MKATVFVDRENQEPKTVERDFDTGIGELLVDGGFENTESYEGPYTLAKLLDDIGLQVEDYDVMPRQALNVAIHALHGALEAKTLDEARHWADAGLRELAMYDHDDDVETEIVPTERPGVADSRASRVDVGEHGRSDYVDWPDKPYRPIGER